MDLVACACCWCWTRCWVLATVSAQLLRYDRSAIAAGGWWRLLTAHIVHLDAHHLILNELGLVLMWSLFAQDYDAVEWCAIVLSGALAISSGLWWLSPRVSWYVGASGVLHSVMAAGAAKHLAQRVLGSLDAQPGSVRQAGVGAMGRLQAPLIVVDAHLYGASVRVCRRRRTVLADRYNSPPISRLEAIIHVTCVCISRSRITVHRHDERAGEGLAVDRSDLCRGLGRAGLRSLAAMPGRTRAKLLNSTECTQPAMLTAGVATYRLWRERGGAQPRLMAGHSLGEFTALVAAGTLEFRTAVDLVKYRGELMQAAVPPGQGAMAAILGLEDHRYRRGLPAKPRRARWWRRSISTRPDRW